MHLFFFNDILGAPLVRALCRTLVHSLWIGLLLFIATGIIMLSAKKSNAVLRYNLLTGVFISFIIGIGVVFLIQITQAVPVAGQSIASSLPVNAAAINTGQHFISGKENISTTINDFLNRSANLIVFCWFLIIVFRSIVFAGGIRKIYQLKNIQLSSPGEEWNKKLILLSRQLGIQGGIRFFQSGIATIPMVAGHFKPVILFPVGLLNSLSIEEAEAILIHELAHIRRKDFIVNMLQHFAEIIFFFNPAVLWVSSLIKIERENCCDDIAVANTGNKRNYINALVSFQEYHLEHLPVVPALADTKKHLLQRVKRILYNNTDSLNKWEKTSLALCLVAVATMTVFFTSAGVNTKNKSASFHAVLSDTSIADRYYDPAIFKEGSTTLLTEKIQGITHVLRICKRNGILYEIYGDVSSFKINGVKIPREEWGKYNKLMASLMKETAGTKDIIQKQKEAEESANRKERYDIDSKTAEKDSKTAEADSKTAEEDSKTSAADSEEQSFSLLTDLTLQADIDKKTADLKKKQAELQKKKDESGKKEIEWRKSIDGIPLIVSKLSYSEKAYKSAATDYAAPAIPYTFADYYNTVASKDGDHSSQTKTYTLTGIQSDGSSPVQNIDIKELTQNFINDLYAANVITGINGLSYNMNPETLIVNGIVQPESLHEKLKKKYIHNADWKLLYNWKQAR